MTELETGRDNSYCSLYYEANDWKSLSSRVNGTLNARVLNSKPICRFYEKLREIIENSPVLGSSQESPGVRVSCL